MRRPRPVAVQSVAALIVAVLAVFAQQLYRHVNDPRRAPDATPPAADYSSARVARSGGGSISRPGVGFRSRQALDEHYRKHGREFGAGVTRDDYLRRAQTLRDAPAGGPVLERKRGDGVITRFDRRTGDFLAFNPDGTIRTYFRPNGGEAYFKRQAQRDDD